MKIKNDGPHDLRTWNDLPLPPGESVEGDFPDNMVAWLCKRGCVADEANPQKASPSLVPDMEPEPPKARKYKRG